MFPRRTQVQLVRSDSYLFLGSPWYRSMYCFYLDELQVPVVVQLSTGVQVPAVQ